MINFYTLLFINSEESSLGNGVDGNYNQKIEAYIKCCSVLNKTLLTQNISSLKVITNNSEKIKEIDEGLECVEIPFSKNIPNDIAFSSAHHKIDVFKFFGTRPESEYSVLLDSDIMCINSMPYAFKKNAMAEHSLFYNITDQQIQSFSAERICKDKELLIRKAFSEKDFMSSSLWAGGEYISGTGSFFKTLYSACIKIMPYYLENAKKLFHNGDEMIVSSALEYLIQKKKIAIFDSGLLGIIGRYYDSSTNHTQHIWKYFSKNFLVHLPMDKTFLASYNVSSTPLADLEKYLASNKTFIEATVRADKTLQSLTKFYYTVRRFIKKITGHGKAPVQY